VKEEEVESGKERAKTNKQKTTFNFKKGSGFMNLE
jgi:hypothetical protein